jgi:hypothetical protein
MPPVVVVPEAPVVPAPESPELVVAALDVLPDPVVTSVPWSSCVSSGPPEHANREIASALWMSR